MVPVVPVDLTVSGPGVAALQRKIAAMNDAAANGLTRELTAGLKVGATPLIPKARSAAATSLPRRGGFAAEVARRPMRIDVRYQRSPGVKLVVDGTAAAAADRGILRHPVFRTGVWVTQSIRPRWFRDAMHREGMQVRPALQLAMRRVAQKIQRA